jgi:tetratricopeptide (TPR) repeat protein
VLVLLGAFTGCSQYSTRPGSVAFHNLTARYNAYHIARTDLSEAERTIQRSYREDYNQMLPLLLPFDSILAQPVKPQLENAIRKASIVAERHQNSKWLDNSYILLGRARLHLGQWDDGVEALRFVFANGRDENDKNESLIWLMRAYTTHGDYANALNVAEYLREQPLPAAATRDFYLGKAYVHQQQGEFLTAVAILEQTLPLVKKSVQKARLHYVSGQLYDRLGQQALANRHYGLVTRNRPSYDLAFNAEMNALQNQVLLDPRSGIASVGFEKMLRDRKNTDLQDRIYYTMGLMAERRGNYPDAIKYLHQSIGVAGARTGQVPYTYLELARIHYDRLENYEGAKAYYDSALVVLPKEAPEFRQVTERKKALDEFVTQLTIVRTEDSLQQLARMNPAALDRKIDAIIEAEEDQKREQLRQAQEALAAGNRPGPSVPGGPSLSGLDRRWELYDPLLVNQGKVEFRRLWGNRTLEDDWRRSTRDTRSFASAGQEALAGPGQPLTGLSAEPATMVPGSAAWLARRELLRSQVPLTDAAIAASLQREEDALYRLGKIYRFDLKEPAKAVATFSRLLQEYPATTHRDELYYLIYLSLPEQEVSRQQWKDKLLAEFPGSTYARLLNQAPRGAGAEAAGLSDNPVKSYETIYGLYAAGNYPEGLTQVEAALTVHQGSTLEDKLALLRIFLVGKVRGKEAYVQAINEFIRLYPSSSLLPRVQEMLEVTSEASTRRKF